MSNVKSLRNWSLTLVAIAAMSYGLYHYKSSEIEAMSAQVQPEFPEPVDAMMAKFVDYKELIKVPAEVVAPDAVMLTSELAGKVIVMNLENGKTVKKGELLLQLDISEEQASLKTAQARVDLARAELKRTKALSKQQLASVNELDQKIADIKINQAEVDRIKAIISKKTVKAPFDGVLGLHNLSVGEYLATNSEITSLVANRGHVWIDVNLSQTQARLLSDDTLQLAINGQVQPLYAEVIAKEPIIESRSRSLKHRAKLVLDTKANLTPGEFIEVVIKQGHAVPMIELPKQAVLRQQGTRYVYVLVPEAGKAGQYRVQRRDITLFQENATDSFIQSGLKEGEQVVTNGAFKLYPNKLVNIRQTQVTQADANVKG
ncbi:efflux RND transporter periplasmic adaptor subunit [Parashewanella spongiae]|uniref:Efflux RND transporter periplasmic adaptor subunit n=1 Tax=Parashewanella spongiae TaxID=342950 RepID=A0A3A6U5A7_9GAMM|nr:efflux RND transporter periplasmic adaptor subunit [Parashewanella spongiae]MCL1079786.1 efflux RND transporter periplasmic adaptor subunit [Parashewanella spongiae]RJY13206.1 efflux RND transporter periplasmic adaptor subunit [Parashewanella spongiae]